MLLSGLGSATEGPGEQIPGFKAEEVQAAYDIITVLSVTAGKVGELWRRVCRQGLWCVSIIQRNEPTTLL